MPAFHINTLGQSLEFIKFHTCKRRDLAIGASVVLAVLLIFRFSILRVFSTEFLGGSSADAGLYVWLVQHAPRDLFRLPWFDTLSFYPYGQSLAYSDNFILPAYAISFFRLLGFGLPVAWNTVMLLAAFLSGFVTFYLVLCLCGQFGPALFAGIAFMLSPAIAGHLGHPQLQFFFWLPLSVLLTLLFFRNWRHVWPLLCGLSFCAAFLSSVYIALFCAFSCAAVAGFIVIMRPRCAPIRTLLRYPLLFLAGAVPVLPFVPPYFRVAAAFGVRALYESFYFSATALSYLSFSPWHWLYGKTSVLSHPEAWLGIGLTIMMGSLLALFAAAPGQKLARPRFLFLVSVTALLLSSLAGTQPGLSRPLSLLIVFFSFASLVAFYRLTVQLSRLERDLKFEIITDRDLLLLMLGTALLFFVLSLGPLGNPDKGQWALGVYRFVYLFVPGIDAIRAVGRFGLVSGFFLVLAVALWLARPHKHPRLVLCVCIVGVMIESRVAYYPQESLPAAPELLTYLKGSADPEDVVIALPFSGELSRTGEVKSWSDFAKLQTVQMNVLFPYGRPVVNGYSGIRTKFMRELPRALAGFPDARSIAALRGIAGLRYLWVDSARISKFSREQFLQRIGFFQELRLIASDPQGNYLLKFEGISPLQPSAGISVPSSHEGTLGVELATKEATTVTVLVNRDTQPIAQLPLEAGSSDFYRFKLPPSAGRTAPYFLQFKAADPGAGATVGKSEYRWQ